MTHYQTTEETRNRKNRFLDSARNLEREAVLAAGVRALYRGGNANNGNNAGPFNVNANNTFSNANTNIGSRAMGHKRHLKTVSRHQFDKR